MSETCGSFIVRRAAAGDMTAVHSMIQELADFEQMSSGPKLSAQDLIRDAGLDGGKEFFHCYILETCQLEPGKTEMKPIGYAICFFAYSTWQGKSYFIEDIYIKYEFRNLGAGAVLLRGIANNAKRFGCKRIDFHVLAWNPARKFYERMGATDMTELEDWHFYRLQEAALNKLAEQ